MAVKYCTFGLLFLGIIICSCVEENSTHTTPTFPNQARQAAQLLLDSLAFPDTAEVFFSGPVAGGTFLREKNRDTTRTPVVLTVPDTVSGAYVFFVNDHWLMMYAHQVRYAWVQPSTGRVEWAAAQWEPVLQEPGSAPTPFAETAQDVFDGMTFHYGHGGGAWQDEGDAVKPDADTLGPGPVSGEPLTACEKKGLVIDCGVDANGYKRNGSASLLADNADLAESFLDDNSFTVQRISQDPSNSLPGLKPDAGHSLYSKFHDIVSSYGESFSCPCDGDPACHEFFLYICAHGSEGLIELNRYDDEGGSTVNYSDLYDWLNAFPSCVKIIVFIDACHSGSAQSDLESLCNTRADCGFTFISTCGAADETPAGFIIDSGTDDWSQGTDDQDGDGKEGDLGDRWLNLADDNSSHHPQRYMCPGQGSMCSTD
jgi:hypothetical protein